MTGRSATITKQAVLGTNSSSNKNNDYQPSLLSIKAKVYNTKISYLLDTFICSEVKQNKDGSITACFKAPDEDWLPYLLLGFGPDLQIISPKHLRNKLISLAENIIKKYNLSLPK